MYWNDGLGEKLNELTPATTGLMPTAKVNGVPITTVTELLPCPSITAGDADISVTLIESKPAGAVSGIAHVRTLLTV